MFQLSTEAHVLLLSPTCGTVLFFLLVLPHDILHFLFCCGLDVEVIASTLVTTYKAFLPPQQWPLSLLPCKVVYTGIPWSPASRETISFFWSNLLSLIPRCCPSALFVYESVGDFHWNLLSGFGWHDQVLSLSFLSMVPFWQAFVAEHRKGRCAENVWLLCNTSLLRDNSVYYGPFLGLSK